MIEVKEEHREDFTNGVLAVLCNTVEEVSALYTYRGHHYATGEELQAQFRAPWAISLSATYQPHEGPHPRRNILYKDFVQAPKPKQLTDLLHTKKVTQDVVPCHICKKEHPVDSEEYFTVYGDVNVGNTGEIIGGNFDKDLNLFRSQSFCRLCLIEFLQEVK